MVPVTNEPKPWSVHVQTTRSDMSDLKHAQLRDFLAGNYMTGSGVNKKLAVHYKFWTKVILPEAEAKAHLEICQLSGELARPGGKRLKAPRNEELYIFPFKTAPAGQLHSALPDCRVTLASYIEGKKLRHVAQDLTSPLKI